MIWRLGSDRLERVQELELSDLVRKRRLDTFMRTPGTGSGTGGVTPMPRRALQLESAVPWWLLPTQQYLYLYLFIIFYSGQNNRPIRTISLCTLHLIY